MSSVPPVPSCHGAHDIKIRPQCCLPCVLNLIMQEEPVEQAAAPARKKRRRDEETTTVANDVKESNTNGHANYRKNIVRIRAKVHCTAAGKPLMDAPCKTNISRSGEANGESGVILPDWHPLAKVRSSFFGHVALGRPEVTSTVYGDSAELQTSQWTRRSCRETCRAKSVCPLNPDAPGLNCTGPQSVCFHVRCRKHARISSKKIKDCSSLPSNKHLSCTHCTPTSICTA